MFPERVQLPGYKLLGRCKDEHFGFWHEDR